MAVLTKFNQLAQAGKAALYVAGTFGTLLPHGVASALLPAEYGVGVPLIELLPFATIVASQAWNWVCGRDMLFARSMRDMNQCIMISAGARMLLDPNPVSMMTNLVVAGLAETGRDYFDKNIAKVERDKATAKAAPPSRAALPTKGH